jgi:RNA polymerase sigma-70 factor (ECF subfamily)
MTEDDLADAYRRFGTMVLRRCRRILRDDAEAEDALQDVFMKLWKYGRAYAEAQSKLLWLYRVADRCCFDRLARRPPRADATTPVVEAEAPGGAQRVDDSDLVVKLLGGVDDRMRQIAVLYYIDEMSQEEIASETGWSRQTINKRLGRLRDELAAARARLVGETP